ncbi:MAG: hypothetical protein AABX23_01095 [Nanoarchaeota archaeon]
MSLGKNIATVGLAGILGGCSATMTNEVFSVIGPMVGVVMVQERNQNVEDKKDNDSTSFLEAGSIYRHPLVKEVNNVPERIRNVPSGRDKSEQGSIEDDSVTVGSRTGMFLRYGQKLRLIREDLLLRVGVEFELGGMLSANTPKKDYAELGESDQNSFLTYYSMHTKAGPNWNSFLIPKLFVGLETNISNSFSVGVDCSIWREDLVAETGYDRYNRDDREAGFNLVDMTVCSITGSLKYRPSNGNYLFLEAGMQNILDKNYHDLGREADIEFGKNPFTVSVGGHLTF